MKNQLYSGNKNIYSFNKKNMSKFQQIIKSRTCWTIVVLFLIGGVQNITGYIPESLMPFINSVLGMLAIYFKVNTNIDYR